MIERVFICTNESRVGLLRAIVGPYLVEEEGPSEFDPNYLLVIDVPYSEWTHLKHVITG